MSCDLRRQIEALHAVEGDDEARLLRLIKQCLDFTTDNFVCSLQSRQDRCSRLSIWCREERGESQSQMRFPCAIAGNGQCKGLVLLAVTPANDGAGETRGVHELVTMPRTHVLLLYTMVLRSVEDERFASGPAPCCICAKPVNANSAVKKTVATEPDNVAKKLWHAINPYRRSS